MGDLKPDLEHLADRLEPSPDAMERLRDRRHRKAIRQRIVAGTMAGVLALGATAAVWVAFSDAGEAPPATTYAPPRVPTVWPESGLEGQETAQVVQYRADNRDPEVAWRRSPDKVVHAFVASVLGWSEPQVREMEPSAGGSFRWYTATERQPCPAETFGCAFVPPGHGPVLRIGVTQPTTQGAAGIWSVATVRSSDLRLAAWADDSPKAGTIHGVAATATGLRTLAGAQWYDGCAAGHDIDDDIRRPSRFEITLPDPAATAGPGCGSIAAGYAFAYAVPRLTQPVGDPLLESAPLTDLTIVPIRVRVAGESTVSSGLSEPVQPTSPHLPSVPWSLDFGYRDPLGWSIAFPPGWGFEPIRSSDETGVTITNDPDALVHPNGVPQHDVLLMTITHVRHPKPWRYPGSENALPFSLANNFALHSNASGTRAPAYGTGIFVLGGYRLDASVVFGKGMDPSTMRMLDRVLATFRFRPLVPGERTGDGDLLVLPYAPPPRGRAVLEPVSPDRALMVVQAAPGWLYALELDLEHYPDLSSWEWDVEAHEVVYETHRWSWDGAPLDGDPTLQLASYPATPGWDGHVLVRTKNTYLEPASAYWP
jgi:hypothetical protein